MKRITMAAAAFVLSILQPPATAPAQGAEASPPSRFGVDAPELAPLGSHAVGVRTLHLREAAQPDVLAFDPASGKAPLRVRDLTVDLWYPALPKPGAAPAVYSAQFPSEPPLPPASFSVTGLAVRDAPAAGKGFPLVVVSHGYSNDPAAMTWLTENLASKGYVVAAIHHDDPPITDRSKFIGPLLRRPLDIAYVTRNLQRMLGAEELIDPSLTALIGYSMGGYGVLTAAGATLDPKGPPTQMIPGGLLMPFVRGAAQAGEVSVKDLKAVVRDLARRGRNPRGLGRRGTARARRTLAPHPGRSRPYRRLCHRRARYFRGRGQCAAISPDLSGRRPRDRAQPAAGIDAQTLMGSGMVSRSGMESGAGERNQRSLHHRVSGSLRQG